ERGRPVGHRTELPRRQGGAWCRPTTGPQRVVQRGVLEPVPVAAYAGGVVVLAPFGNHAPATLRPTVGRTVPPAEPRRPLQNPEKTGAAGIIFGASPPAPRETKNPDAIQSDHQTRHLRQPDVGKCSFDGKVHLPGLNTFGLRA